MDNLPIDIIFSILAYVNISDVYVLSAVNKKLRNIISNYDISQHDDEKCKIARDFHSGKLDKYKMYECYEKNYTFYTQHYYLASYLKFLMNDQAPNIECTYNRMKQCYDLFIKIEYDSRIHLMFAAACGYYISRFEHLSTLKGCKRMGRRRANRIKQILEKLKNIKQSNHIYTGPVFIFLRNHNYS